MLCPLAQSASYTASNEILECFSKTCTSTKKKCFTQMHMFTIHLHNKSLATGIISAKLLQLIVLMKNFKAVICDRLAKLQMKHREEL